MKSPTNLALVMRGPLCIVGALAIPWPDLPWPYLLIVFLFGPWIVGNYAYCLFHHFLAQAQ
jgi:hypothetical protein